MNSTINQMGGFKDLKHDNLTRTFQRLSRISRKALNLNEAALWRLKEKGNFLFIKLSWQLLPAVFVQDPFRRANVE